HREQEHGLDGLLTVVGDGDRHEHVDLALGGLGVELVGLHDGVGGVPVGLAEGDVDGAAAAVLEREGLADPVGLVSGAGGVVLGPAGAVGGLLGGGLGVLGVLGRGRLLLGRLLLGGLVRRLPGRLGLGADGNGIGLLIPVARQQE